MRRSRPERRLLVATTRAVAARRRDISEGSRHAAWSTVQSRQHDPPDHPKGGELLVLRLFALTQAFPGKLNALRRHEDGQTMAEYGVVLAVMTLAVLASMTLLSDNVRSAFESIAALLPG